MAPRSQPGRSSSAAAGRPPRSGAAPARAPVPPARRGAPAGAPAAPSPLPSGPRTTETFGERPSSASSSLPASPTRTTTVEDSRRIASDGKAPPPRPRGTGSGHDPQRLLDEVLQVGEEGRGGGAVDDAVVDGQRQRHRGADRDLVPAHDRLADGGAHRQDRGLRRIDHGGELPDPVHAEVADGERAAGQLARRDPPRPGPAR